MKVTKEIYLLCKELERLEEILEFSVFYSFSEILTSHHFCPGFTFEDVYYEVQYDNENCLTLIDFGRKGFREEGDIMSEKEIENLTLGLKKL